MGIRTATTNQFGILKGKLRIYIYILYKPLLGDLLETNNAPIMDNVSQYLSEVLWCYHITFHGLGANICDCKDLKQWQAEDGKGRCFLENGRCTTTIFKMVEDVQGIYILYRGIVFVCVFCWGTCASSNLHAWPREIPCGVLWSYIPKVRKKIHVSLEPLKLTESLLRR